jgi:serine/threonine-protein kinase
VPELEAVRDVSGESDFSVSKPLSGLTAFATRSSKRNPYLNRVMINNPSDFFGRRKEIRKIYSRLDAPHPQSISIVGERRIGKSSLLNYIFHPKNRKPNMTNYDNAIFAYLDFQRDVDFDIPRFIDFLFNMFSYDKKTESRYSARGRTLEELKKVVEDLHGKGKRMIILMDEFESITRNEKFDEQFFSFLRSLANSYRVAYVTSSHDELQMMCHNKDISDSPFFNIFSSMPLRTFDEKEAMELICSPSKREGVPLERFADQIIDLAGYFPFYLQIACSNVFEHIVDQPDADADWQQIKASFTDEVYPHFNFVWERMDEPSRESLQQLAAGKTTGRKYDYVNEDLIRRGYLHKSNGKLVFSSSVWRQFVIDEGRRDGQGRGFLGSLLRRGRKR